MKQIKSINLLVDLINMQTCDYVDPVSVPIVYILQEKYNKMNKYMKNLFSTKIIYLINNNILLFFYDVYYLKLEKFQSYGDAIYWQFLKLFFFSRITTAQAECSMSQDN